MISLLDLPNKLLLIIFCSSLDARTAARLSQVNKTFNQLWNGCINTILTSSFKREFLAYDEALILAKAELQPQAENLGTSDIDIRRLASKLLANEKVLARVLPLYKLKFDKRNGLHVRDVHCGGYRLECIYAAKTSARAYFYGRFAALALADMNRRDSAGDVQRELLRQMKRLSFDEREYYRYFLNWFLNTLEDQQLRALHRLGSSCDYYVTPNEWLLAHHTCHAKGMK